MVTPPDVQQRVRQRHLIPMSRTGWMKSGGKPGKTFVRGLLAALAAAVLLAGCHADTTDIPKHASPQAKARARQIIGEQQSQHPEEPEPKAGDDVPSSTSATHPESVPTPPSADQISPDSPKAVLDGTSTTQPAKPQKPR